MQKERKKEMNMKTIDAMTYMIREFFGGHLIIKLVLIGICMDVFFGTIRAWKYKKPNSSIGIDGAIRKISMIAGIAFMVVLDYMLNINLSRFVPDKVLEYIKLENIGLTEFFGLLFIAYEALSVLKNMYLCNLPVKKVWLYVNGFLTKYTDELPSTDLTQEEAIQQMAADIREINRTLSMTEEE